MVRKGYKQTEVGEIPEDWVLSTIGNYTMWLSGGTPSRSNEGYWNGSIPWISGSTLKTIEILTSDQFLTEEAVNNGSKMAPLRSTLLLVRGSALHNEIRAGLVVAPVSFNQDVKALVPNSKLEPKYLTLSILGSRHKLLKLVSSAGNSAGVLDTKLVQDFLLRVPPRKEQKAIATALTDIDNLIISLETLIAKKRAIKTATMQQLLTGKKRLPGFGEGKGMKQTELGEVPEDWEVVEFPKIVWFQEGPGVRKYQFTSSGIKLLNGTNIEKGKLLLDKTQRYIATSLAFGQYQHFMIDEGDILIACSGVTIERFEEKVTLVNSCDLPLCLNTSTMRFKVQSQEVDKGFIVAFLKSMFFKNQIGGTATGSAQLNFGPFHVNKVKIAMPSHEEQIDISAFLSNLDEDILAQEQLISKVRAIKQGMMQELLTGRTRLIDVPMPNDATEEQWMHGP